MPDPLVGEDPDDAALAEKPGDVQRVVAFGKHAGAIGLAAGEHPLRPTTVVERPVKRAGPRSWREKMDDAAEDFPVPHVGEQQHDALAAGERLFEQFEVFDVDDLAELFRGEPGGAGGGNQVAAGAAEGFPGHPPEFGQLLFPGEGDPQISQDHLPAQRHEVPGQAAERLAQPENPRPGKQPREPLDQRVAQAFQPPLPGLRGIFRFAAHGESGRPSRT